MKELALAAITPSAGAQENRDTDADGFPIVPPSADGKAGGVSTVSLAGRGTRIRAQQVTVQEFVNELMRRQLLGRTVRDETGLAEKYNFILTFSFAGLNQAGGARNSGPPPQPIA